ncbi:MAG: hypothetical protein ACJ757_03560 [Gaiellaceae bacterium]
MKALAVAVIAACIATPVALAKFRMTMTLGDSTPRAGHRFTVIVHTEQAIPPNDYIKLIAVAPGEDWYQVVGTVTGDASRTHADIPHDGFQIKLVRVGPKMWRAVTRLPRPGRWRLLVPNGTKDGFMMPPPLVRWVRVSP